MIKGLWIVGGKRIGQLIGCVALWGAPGPKEVRIAAETALQFLVLLEQEHCNPRPEESTHFNSFSAPPPNFLAIRTCRG